MPRNRFFFQVGCKQQAKQQQGHSPPPDLKTLCQYHLTTKRKTTFQNAVFMLLNYHFTLHVAFQLSWTPVPYHLERGSILTGTGFQMTWNRRTS
ncbi:hypothetical protein HMPREF1991_00674 [Hoylesella loescheii DSM 19665 = JCM 12249 = ATCC 15930]|uniref:Uncharacterized protein n=1 Tax=Hoylesella loescheii DSM 19665 = JCM 12249 = ATCC 15930 TaxID=1122985 RepID=A0A069QKH8_HOYLO|nr:hypothetical protein HMPREF1991_00674 [Hoylesella loescheii DSM 19665 = JCM 12249 = ATCC 15930]